MRMTRRTHALCLATCAALLCSAAALAAASKWKKHGSKKGVTVYTRSVDGSEVHETKGVTSIDAAPGDVWDFISDPDKLMSITPELVEWKSLGSCGDRCEYVYQRMHHPLIKDRHAVMKLRWKITEKDGETSYRRWFVLTGEKPLPKVEAVTFRSLSGSWSLRPGAEDGTTRVVYLSHADAGGKLPVTFLNKGILGRTYDILKTLRKKL
jgi:hypothetical protein